MTNMTNFWLRVIYIYHNTMTRPTCTVARSVSLPAVGYFLNRICNESAAYIYVYLCIIYLHPMRHHAWFPKLIIQKSVSQSGSKNSSHAFNACVYIAFKEMYTVVAIIM